ncbi:MAG: hypothetical protein C4519_21315 [Desulfobacteraceae bacterium]|nr:MAG: hypothetical protein C4519_21315 [Desulfobacteraceae bacterium]
MGFRENLLQKVHIDRLADQVLRSLRPADPPQRIDRAAMQDLLDLGDYEHRHERDLDLYFRITDGGGKQLIVVLDNELKLYHTTVEDVVLRKSPTVKEMVSIRNAIKILNDKDVVVSSKSDTLRRLQTELIDALDLSYTPADIEAFEADGRQALQNGYADGVTEVLTLLAEVLGYAKAPKAFQIPHHHVWGAMVKNEGIEIQMGPIVLFSLVHLTLRMVKQPISTLDKAALTRFQQVIRGEAQADLEGPAVFTALKEQVLAQKPRIINPKAE